MSKIHKQITEATWIKHHHAVDQDGYCVDTHSPKACRWCLSGWLGKVYLKPGPMCVVPLEQYKKIVNELEIDEYGIPDWNDHPDITFQDVKDLLEKLDV